MFRVRRAWPLVMLLFAGDACEKKAPPSTIAPPPGMPPSENQAALTASETRTSALPPPLPPGHPALLPEHPTAIDPNGAPPAHIPFDPKSVLSGVMRLDD